MELADEPHQSAWWSYSCSRKSRCCPLLWLPRRCSPLQPWWWHPRLGWASLGILATAVGMVFYWPIRTAFPSPQSDFDGFGILAEYIVVGEFLLVLHAGLVFTII